MWRRTWRVWFSLALRGCPRPLGPGGRRCHDGGVRTYLAGRVLVKWAAVAVAEGMARDLTVELTGRDPGPLHHSCPFCGSVEHGRPYVEAPVHVSVAHAPGLTVVAVTDVGPVGVDVEEGPAHEWVVREALGKAQGVGILGEASTDGELPVLLSERLDVPGHAGAVIVLEPSAGLGARSWTAKHRTAR